MKTKKSKSNEIKYIKLVVIRDYESAFDALTLIYSFIS